MSEFEIDKLFRQKLAGKKVNPSNEAWKKLSSEIGRNNQKKAWPLWSAAASVVVVFGIAIYFLIPTPTGDMSKNEDKRINERVPEVLNDKESPEAEEPMPLSLGKEQLAFQPDTKKGEVENSDIAKSPEEKHEVTIEENKPLETLKTEEVTIAETVQIEEEEELLHQVVVDDALALAGNTNEGEEPSYDESQQAYPEIKIVYKSSDKNKSKLQEDKPAFRKVVALARDIKEADIGLGTLREAKNELLAFGYKKTKELGN